MNDVENVQEALESLRGYRKVHLDLAKYVLGANEGSLFPLDFLMIAAFNRSLCLLRGFCDLIERHNFLSAAPLLRLQLDNCLRILGASLTDNPNDFVVKMIRGTQISKLKDQSGKRMTDRYLVSKLDEKYPGILKVYASLSGYVHLSDRHIFHALQLLPGEQGKFNARITGEDNYVSDDDYIEIIEAFQEITKILLDFIHSWGFVKENPEDRRVNRWRNTKL